MEFIEYIGNNKFFAGLIKNKEQYMIVFGRINGFTIDSISTSDNILVSQSATISTTFTPINDRLFTIISINNREEFYTIAKVLRCIYE